MGNMGKVRRVVRETVAVLVDELGHESAANVLERQAALLRGTGYRPGQAKTNEDQQIAIRNRTAANG
jgi:hypothetical protein